MGRPAIANGLRIHSLKLSICHGKSDDRRLPIDGSSRIQPRRAQADRKKTGIGDFRREFGTREFSRLRIQSQMIDPLAQSIFGSRRPDPDVDESGLRHRCKSEECGKDEG